MGDRVNYRVPQTGQGSGYDDAPCRFEVPRGPGAHAGISLREHIRAIEHLSAGGNPAFVFERALSVLTQKIGFESGLQSLRLCRWGMFQLVRGAQPVVPGKTENTLDTAQLPERELKNLPTF